MAIKFQYNKTSLNDLGKQLKIRERALPTIKSKESALRVEVKKAKDQASEVERELKRFMEQYDYMSALWSEFDGSLVAVEDVEISKSKIAGVFIPTLDKVHFVQKDYSLFSSALWIGDGIELLKNAAQMGLRYEVLHQRVEVLDYARKKTTQKVNLYEKVQIPGYQEAIRKIKRFMEDEENLSKSSQKIVKTRHKKAEEASL